MIRNSGISVTICGTIIMAMNSQNSGSRPGKSRRANAYAASVVNTSCPTVMATATSAVCTMNPDMSYCCHSWVKFDQVAGTAGVQAWVESSVDCGLNAAFMVIGYGATETRPPSPSSR